MDEKDLFVGAVIMYDEAKLDELPDGWQLADGTNGTPRIDRRVSLSDGSVAVFVQRVS